MEDDSFTYPDSVPTSLVNRLKQDAVHGGDPRSRDDTLEELASYVGVDSSTYKMEEFKIYTFIADGPDLLKVNEEWSEAERSSVQILQMKNFPQKKIRDELRRLRTKDDGTIEPIFPKVKVLSFLDGSVISMLPMNVVTSELTTHGIDTINSLDYLISKPGKVFVNGVEMTLDENGEVQELKGDNNEMKIAGVTAILEWQKGDL